MGSKRLLLGFAMLTMFLLYSPELKAADGIRKTVPFGDLSPGQMFFVREVEYLKMEPIDATHRYNIVCIRSGAPWGMSDDYPVEILVRENQ